MKIMLTELNKKDFDKVYHILQESFPRDEIRTYELQKALLSNPIYKIYVVHTEDCQDIKALIAVYELDEFLFVEHFAVNAKYRNQGLGAMVLQELIKCSDKMLCLEVELPTTDLAKRRIEFYKRNGLYFNDYSYEQPPLAPNQRAVELRIMSSGKRLSEQEFEKVKELLYTEVYRTGKLSEKHSK